MKILLTGASGFLGSEFMRQALEAGHDLTVMGREWTDENTLLRTKWDNFDAVVHLAAAGVKRNPPRQWPACMTVNFHALRRMLAAIKASGASPLIFLAGSVRENEMTDRPSLWHDPYVVSKRMAALMVKDWANHYRGRVVHWHFHSFYAPGEVHSAAQTIIQLL
jgi:nucleoside-diphosphate-sugar epimerase